MSGEDEGTLLFDILKDIPELATTGRIQSGCWLIQEYDLRISHQ